MTKKKNLIEEIITTHILPEDPNEEPLLLSKDFKDAIAKTEDAKNLRDKPYLTTDMMNNNIDSVELDIPIDARKLTKDILYLETVVRLFLNQMVTIAKKDFEQSPGVFKCDFTDKVLKFIDAQLKITEIESKIGLSKSENQDTSLEEDKKLLEAYTKYLTEDKKEL